MRSRALLICTVWMFFCSCALGEPGDETGVPAGSGHRQIDEFHWEGIARIVAVGDLHGDYDQYIKVLESAGLINARGKWTGGDTHLVQTGDIPDRGPDTRKIIDHIQGLKKQAERKGGRVHTLIGNHEAMNSYGDLRYAVPAEFTAFAGPRSKFLQDKQFEFQLNQLKQTKPEVFLTLDLEKYRIEWEKKVPLGWVEHRFAWMPEGDYGKLVLANPVSIMLNDTIFLHGGISPEYCRYSLQELSEQVWDRLKNYDPANMGILNDENGPLWYRGLARENELLFDAKVSQILDRYQASRIVVGHTPTGGVVWPRFNGKVVVNDTGIAAYYGGNDAYLEISGGQAMAGYGTVKLEIPVTVGQRLDYLRTVAGMKPDNKELQEMLTKQLNPEPEAETGPDVEPPEAAAGSEPDQAAAISAGICS